MPYKERTVEKLYHSIGEVAERLGVNTSLIRYWEKEFGTLRPRRNGKGDRLYTMKDIAQLERIHHLVKEKGFTLNGAKEALRENTSRPEPGADDTIRERLMTVREKLVEWRGSLLERE
ncbi:MAG: MerR family transcriptional regulator [Flavobacteriales bacterium]|nr:MerR family transcriptional regulator [Flavobacteriales bacterium]MBP6696322.1 MerR family transcriptional regulator [Flavobacteriales bacterium]